MSPTPNLFQENLARARENLLAWVNGKPDPVTAQVMLEQRCLSCSYICKAKFWIAGEVTKDRVITATAYNCPVLSLFAPAALDMTVRSLDKEYSGHGVFRKAIDAILQEASKPLRIARLLSSAQIDEKAAQQFLQTEFPGLDYPMQVAILNAIRDIRLEAK